MDERRSPTKTPDTETEVTVGSRVRVLRDAEAAVLGEVVEDYTALVDTGERGHDWAPTHRWAIALDDGRVFSDTEDLTVEPGSPRAAPEADPPE
ncbi:hypothetical protein ACFTWF_24460 [Rhodococcus sp. NPDC056960]|uniref:hypothetical protein n=1 Tax=Rhodococcus sp. NPDC056960 TaxID=3345982 RepID=UPI00362B3AD4